MSHSYHPYHGCLEIDVVSLFANVSIGGTGAPTLNVSPGSKGFVSVVRNSAGKYTFTLDESYQALLFAGVSVLDSTASDPTAVGVVARIFAQDVANGTTPTFVISFYKMSDGTAVDPRSGAVLLVKADLRYSTVI